MAKASGLASNSNNYTNAFHLDNHQTSLYSRNDILHTPHFVIENIKKAEI